MSDLAQYEDLGFTPLLRRDAMKWWIFISVLTFGLLLFLAGNWAYKRINADYFALEHDVHQEFADKASSLDGVGLRIFALTNYLAFLEQDGQMLSLATNDFNFLLLQTHGRLFRLYSNLTNHSEAEKHFLAASNYYRSLRPKPLEKSFVVTNAAFDVRMD